MCDSGEDRLGAAEPVRPVIAPPPAARTPGTTLEGIEGIVKWFDPRKGYGFITGPEGQDIFAHYSVIQGEGFRALSDGAAITYDAHQTPKGWKATRVVRREVIEVTQAAKKGYSRTPRRAS